MTDLKEVYKKRRRELQNTASTKWDWAIGLAFVPIVNLVATPALLSSARKDDIIHQDRQNEPQMLQKNCVV